MTLLGTASHALRPCDSGGVTPRWLKHTLGASDNIAIPGSVVVCMPCVQAAAADERWDVLAVLVKELGSRDAHALTGKLS